MAFNEATGFFPVGPELFWQQPIDSSPTRARSAAAMRLQTYRDEARSRHFDLVGGGGHPWSIDLVAATAAGILVVGFACALVALWVR